MMGSDRVAAVFALWLAGTSAAATAATETPGVPVEASKPIRRTVTDVVTAVGSLQSNESVIIRSEIDGRIEKIHFTEGQPIKAGQLLVSLDASVQRAELAEAQAQLELSERNFKRARELFDRGVATGRTLDEAEASLESTKARVALLRARLEKTEIRAPFEGVVGLRLVSPGDYLEAGNDIVNLEDLDPVKVDFRIPERMLRNVTVGQKIEVTVDALPDQTFEGTVYAIDPKIDPATRSIALRARVPNPDGLLRAGLFAQIRLIVDERKDALVVPEQAVVPRGSERFVYRIADGTARLVKVALGWRGQGLVEVKSGIGADDLIVTAGHIKLKDGVPVSVLKPQKEP